MNPILDVKFEGLHWIEASAGSGKTYTLAGLVVRILLEKYLPRQVVATTFTRAAAAELKARIRKELVKMQIFFIERQQKLPADNQKLAKALYATEPLKAKLLDDFAEQIQYACERLKLVIEQIDELFVGTLDSFSQKLLREFSFESGKIEQANITESAKKYSHELIHDTLRAWIQQQPQQKIDWLYETKNIKPVSDYIKLVEQALNFSSAILKAPTSPEFNTTPFEQAMLALVEMQAEIKTLEPYYLLDGDYYKFISKVAFKADKFYLFFTQDLPHLITQFQTHGCQVFFKNNLFLPLKNLLLDSKGNQRNNTFSKKCDETVIQNFDDHPVIQCLKKVFEEYQNLEKMLQGIDAFLKYYLCQQVKQKLPERLQQKGETTFAQQIKTLADALKGEQGELFASFVQTRYPLILVDEFQDTNQEQDDMLASIWRHSKRYTKGCMIMVGDRKQAIYGFRGGDMLTFRKAEQDVRHKQGKFYRLKYNFRTVAPLLEAVDSLFLRAPDFGENVIYESVMAGTKPISPLIDFSAQNPTPLKWLTIGEDVKSEVQVAWKISSLLQQAQQGDLSINHCPIVEDDIAVLSWGHKGLDNVQYQLEKLGIGVNRPAKKSVFESPIAQDVAAVLTAIMDPYNEAKVKRALLSRLLNQNLRQLQKLEKQADGLSRYIMIFDEIRELWFERNFLSAWQYCLKYFNVWENLVASQSRDNERTVVNVRHLTELLSQHSTDYQGPHNLYQWYFKQLARPSEREWELERKLSNAKGVQLMTIHQSKGLEFKIVFLLNADGKETEPNKTLNFSTLKQAEQPHRVIEINDKNLLSEDAVLEHEERLKAEQHRLWYVALTRAVYRIYVVLEDKKQGAQTGVGFWKNQDGEFVHVASADEPMISDAPAKFQPQQIQNEAIAALEFPKMRFYPRGKTSFTGLAQHLSKQQALDVLADQNNKEELTDDEIFEPIEDVASEHADKIAWINRHFPMGKQAGNFLHEIFEHLDFTDTQFWELEISRRFKNDYANLQEELLQKYVARDLDQNTMLLEVQNWLQNIMTTPLHQQFSLNMLKKGHYLSEFDFYLALSDQVFAVQRIQKLLEEYNIHIPDLYRAESARFLTGAIDLVYEYKGKFYIADYKSNFLGDSSVHYKTQHLKNNMTTSSYWLQASLYMVALHRYLKQRLNDYAIEHHLGGASYLYLRGMTGNAGDGVCYWQPDIEFILRLDAVLGYFDA